MYSLFIILIQTIMLILSIYETEKRLIEAFDKEGKKSFRFFDFYLKQSV